MSLTDAPGMGFAEAPQRCRPNYEEQIKNLIDSLYKNETLYDALMAYLGTRHVGPDVAKFIGELTMEKKILLRDIDTTIKQQEKDQD